MERCSDPWFAECRLLAEQMQLHCYDLRWIEGKEILQVVLGKSAADGRCILDHKDCKAFTEVLLEKASFIAEISEDVGIEVSSPGEQIPLRAEEDLKRRLGKRFL